MDIGADDNLQLFLPEQPPPTYHDMPTTIATLNHLLTNELIAAEACRGASRWFDHLPVAALLRDVVAGHQHRAGVLFESIRALHGRPLLDPRIQDSPAEKNQPADVRTVLGLLLELEQRGVSGYRQALALLDDLTRTMVEADLLPAQERALASISAAQPPDPSGAV